MTASAAERSETLGPIVEAARQHVAELQARAAAMDEAARRAYERADEAAGHAAVEVAEAARRDLGVAQAKLQGLLTAEQAVSSERQQDLWRQQVAELKAREEAELDERDANLALVVPALVACREAMRRATQAEQQARRLEMERDALEAELEGRTWRKPRPTHSRVDAVIGSSQLLVTLQRSSFEMGGVVQDRPPAV